VLARNRKWKEGHCFPPTNLGVPKYKYLVRCQGRTIQHSTNAETRRGALDVLKDEILKYSNGDAIPDGKVTVDSLYDVLLSDYRINGRALDWAQSVWDCHLKGFFGAWIRIRASQGSASRG
jgi:hypothetical protein